MGQKWLGPSAVLGAESETSDDSGFSEKSLETREMQLCEDEASNGAGRAGWRPAPFCVKRPKEQASTPVTRGGTGRLLGCLVVPPRGGPRGWCLWSLKCVLWHWGSVEDFDPRGLWPPGRQEMTLAAESG